MDCEGCEYNIILKDYDTIKEFNEIISKYHGKNTRILVNKLLEKLNNDFECKIIKEKSKDIELIHCIRKNNLNFILIIFFYESFSSSY
jgi:hypothetical protein